MQQMWLWQVDRCTTAGAFSRWPLAWGTDTFAAHIPIPHMSYSQNGVCMCAHVWCWVGVLGGWGAEYSNFVSVVARRRVCLHYSFVTVFDIETKFLEAVSMVNYNYSYVAVSAAPSLPSLPCPR